MIRSNIASLHAPGKIIAFIAADALRLTEPRSLEEQARRVATPGLP